MICCCVEDETPRPGCLYCGGSGWALPCPGCAGLGRTIQQGGEATRLCDQCRGKRVQPILSLVVDAKEAS